MFNIGDIVNLNGSNMTGKIIQKNNKKNTYYYTILINNKMVETKEENLKKCINISNEKTSIKKHNIKISVDICKDNLETELMLRHKTKEEAIILLDKFIDNAICNNISKLKIVHGKNGGIIRNAVHEYLKKCPYVLSYRLGDYYEGQYGVTIVILK